MRMLFVAGLTAAICLAYTSETAAAPPSGQTQDATLVPRFEGQIDTRWLPDGRHMELLADYTYVDAANEIWTAPKGTMVDGASIPQFAWSLIGGPFEGKYRGPSVLHDWYCDTRTRTWQDVDRMFLRAMLTAGVEPLKAQTMFAAVWAFGPRWDFQAIHNEQLRSDMTVILDRYGEEHTDKTSNLAPGKTMIMFLKQHQAEISEAPAPVPSPQLKKVDFQTQKEFSAVYDELAGEAQKSGGSSSSGTAAPSTAAFNILLGQGVVTEVGPVARVAMPIASPQITTAAADRLVKEAGAKLMTENELEMLADPLAPKD